jgi:hypothetical protein
MTMNSTPASARSPQKRSSGLGSEVSAKLLDPQGGPALTLSPPGSLLERQSHVGPDQRQVHAILIVLR